MVRRNGRCESEAELEVCLDSARQSGHTQLRLRPTLTMIILTTEEHLTAVAHREMINELSTVRNGYGRWTNHGLKVELSVGRM